LFHNGHWSPYKDKGIDGAIRNRVKVPEGKWSDTRVMAWLAHLHSHSILELIDEKVIVFGPEKIEIFNHAQFSRVNDLLVSNRGWEGYSYKSTDHRSFPRTLMDDDEAVDAALGHSRDNVCRHIECHDPI